MLKSSKSLFKIYYELCRAISLNGHIPPTWRIDLISFLYKRKGDRMVAKNWRPITIAPSLGKHYEKLIREKLTLADDKNEDNHAYTPEKSCLSAILTVSEFLKKMRKKSKELRKHGLMLIPILLAEDISAAFESIDHDLIANFVKENFHETLGDFPYERTGHQLPGQKSVHY